MGKIALSSPSSLPEEQGRGRRAGDGLGPAAWEPKGGQRGGEELEGAEGFDSPTCVGPRRPVVAWPWWPAEMAGGGRGGGTVGSGRGHAVVGGIMEVEEVLSLPSPWAETARRGGSTVACSGRL